MSIEALKEICDQNDVKYSTEEDLRRRFHIHIPKARNVSRLAVNEEASGLLIEHAPDFYKYRFVEGYEAIWSAEEGTLECEIQLPHGRFPLQRLLRQNSESNDNESFTIPSFLDGVEIEISKGTNVFALFTLLRDQFYRPLRNFDRIRDYSATIKMSGLEISRHEEALSLVEKVCSSICFQIDCKTELPVMLAFERKARSDRANA